VTSSRFGPHAGGLRPVPLLRLHLRRTALTPQILLLGTYLIIVGFSHLTRRAYRTDVSERLEVFLLLLILFLPFWLADPGLRRSSPLQLLVAPRRSLLPVFGAYVTARLLLALAAVTLAFLASAHRDLLAVPAAHVREIALQALVLIAFYVPAGVLGTLTLRQPLLGSILSIPAFLLLVFLCRRFDACSLLLRWFALPHEMFSPRVVTIPVSVAAAQILACFLFWSALGYVVYRGGYR
jgi:hypothetical protein